MDNINSVGFKTSLIAAALLIHLSIILTLKANGQIISSACTASTMNIFTPCVNYITGSSANGRSPTADCCDSFKSVLEDGVDCACLIVTGNVPISLPFNRTLAISLPKACRSALPLQCKDTAAPLPAPGPVLFGPSSAPASGPVSAAPFSPRASKVSANSPLSVETPPAPSPVATSAPVTHRRSRPAITNPSASGRLYIPFPAIVLLMFLISIFG